MRNKKPYYFIPLFFVILIAIISSCTNTKSEKDTSSYEIISQKSFGITKIIYCLVSDSSETSLKNIGDKLCKDKKNTYIYFYMDKKNSTIDLEKCTDMYAAIPKDGFDAQYSSSNGLIKY